MTKRLVGGEGPLIGCKIALIGEAAGAMEERLGRPFVGPAGQYLTKILHAVGISRNDIYITNVVKEHPPGDNITPWFATSGKGVKCSPAFMDYIRQLHEELSHCTANVLVPMGNVPLFALTGLTGVTKRRGSILESTLMPGRKVIPTIHPSAALRQYMFTHFIRMDLRRVVVESETPDIVYTQRELLIEPSYHEILGFLNECCASELIAFDIEVVNEEVSCISFAASPTRVMSIPFTSLHGPYMTPPQEMEVWKLIAQVLEDPRAKKVGQNSIFDCSFLYRKYGIKTRNVEDTMIATGIYTPDFPKGLDFITSIYTREPYYKDEGKKWFKIGGSDQTFWLYNAKDSAVTLEAFGALTGELRKQNNIHSYEKQRDLIEPLMFMQERGMRVDLDGLHKQSSEAGIKIDELTTKLHDCCGFAINANSPQQLANYFYSQKGYQTYYKGGSITTNIDALKRLARSGSVEASILMELRRWSKLKSTYFDMTLSKDNRLRSAMNPVGTNTGRLSSSQDIFGEGGNVQNLPPIFKRFILADEGYIAYDFDLSGADNRVVAYIAPESLMRSAFETGQDLHKLTASLIFSIPVEEVSDEEGSSPLGGGLYSQRFWGKKANHCRLGSCEVLSTEGWVGIAEACERDMTIAQWDKDGLIQFVKADSWYKDTYTGDVITYSGRDVYQSMTPDHRIFCTNRNDARKARDFRADELKLTSSWEWPTSGVLTNGELDIPPDYIRLIVAFQADGSWNYHSPRWHMKSEFKITRLRLILTMLGCSYSQYIAGDGMTIIQMKAENIERDMLFKLFYGRGKYWPVEFLQLSRDAMYAFCDEITHWDGDGNSYWTTLESNADIVQAIFHMSGFKSHIGWASWATRTYRVSKIPKTETRLDTLKKSVKQVVDEPIYCPTVPSGYFLSREEGIVSVTGNSLNYGLGFRSFALRFELPEREAKWIVDRYHQAYPGIRQYWAWIQAQLNKNRTLETPFARKRLFLDRWGEELFKQAYAFIPQSTVADKINQHGIIFVYFNQDLFGHVELLNQVHDSIVIQIPISAGWEYHATVVRAILDRLATPVPWHGTEFIIPAEVKMGLNLKDMTKIKVQSASEIERIYNDLIATPDTTINDEDLEVENGDDTSITEAE